MLHPFRLPTRLLMAPGALAQLPEVVAGYSPERVLLVTDPGLEDTGWPERIWQALAEINIEAITFDDVEANPRASTVDRMAEWAKAEGATLVLGVGGGSVLDAAKAAAMVMTNGGAAASYEGRDRYAEKPLPFIAVPTTCGTGSEVTWVSVLTVEERYAKISVKGEAMFPDWAVVDPELLRTLPGRLVAWTGMDALTHALEAATGRRANPVSDTLAADAASLLFRYLRRAAEDIEGDAEAREAVMRASTLAGLAFGNADVAAVHCLSETLGGRYDLPHGLANAALLRPVLEYNLPATRDKLAALATAAGLGATAEDLLKAVEDLLDALDIPGFPAFGIPREDHPWIAERAAQNGSNASNAREMGAEQYLELLEGL
ncbi:MAG: iron-containing alcohol dehydrogenase family protein [Thermoanaerobaculia bacterium]